MANVNHSTLTDPYLHEPKGVASAGAGELYYANGTGSGSWLPSHVHCTADAGFNTAGVASVSVSTAQTPIVPTSGYTLYNNEGFQLIAAGALTGSGLEYTGSPDIHVDIVATFSVKQSSGGNAQLQFYINDDPFTSTGIPGSKSIITSTSGDWHQVTCFAQKTLSQYDQFFVEVISDISATVTIANAMIKVSGIPEV